MKKEIYMARVCDKNTIRDLNEINDGYPVYFEDRKQAIGSLQAFLIRQPQILYGHIIKLDGTGHYKTIFKANY